MFQRNAHGRLIIFALKQSLPWGRFLTLEQQVFSHRVASIPVISMGKDTAASFMTRLFFMDLPF